jgi:predicted phage-related endonuclease
LEVKTVGTHAKVAAEWRRGGIAAHAYVQLQWQLAVTGRAHGWLAAYTIDTEPQIRGPVERDEPLIERIRTRVHDWWAAHVVTGTPPAPDLAAITDEEIALRWPMADPGSTAQAQWPAHLRALLAERAECHSRLTDAKKRKDEIDQALKVMVGESEALLIGDRPVVTLKSAMNNPSVAPALEVDHPEIYSEYIRRGSSRRIHIVKGWKEA